MPCIRRLAWIAALTLPVAAGATAAEVGAAAATTCEQADIADDWLMMVNSAEDAPLICRIRINATGGIAASDCTVGRLTGELLVDRKNCGIYSTGLKLVRGDSTLIAYDVSLGVMTPDRNLFSLISTAVKENGVSWSLLQRIPD